MLSLSVGNVVWSVRDARRDSAMVMFSLCVTAWYVRVTVVNVGPALLVFLSYAEAALMTTYANGCGFLASGCRVLMTLVILGVITGVWLTAVISCWKPVSLGVLKLGYMKLVRIRCWLVLLSCLRRGSRVCVQDLWSLLVDRIMMWLACLGVTFVMGCLRTREIVSFISVCAPFLWLGVVNKEVLLTGNVVCRLLCYRRGRGSSVVATLLLAKFARCGCRVLISGWGPCVGPGLGFLFTLGILLSLLRSGGLGGGLSLGLGLGVRWLKLGGGCV